MKTKHRVGFLLSRTSLSWVIYGLLTVAVLLMQTAPRFFPAIGYARPVPLVLLVVCVAMFEGVRFGVGIGLLAGLLWDVYSFRLFGYDGLVLMAIGMTVGLLVQWLLRANFLSAMLLCVSGVLVHTLLEWLFCYVIFLKEEVWTVLLRVYLPNALYTVLLAPLVYWGILGIAQRLRRRSNG